jgi:hypothetical protein
MFCSMMGAMLLIETAISGTHHNICVTLTHSIPTVIDGSGHEINPSLG